METGPRLLQMQVWVSGHPGTRPPWVVLSRDFCRDQGGGPGRRQGTEMKSRATVAGANEITTRGCWLKPLPHYLVMDSTTQGVASCPGALSAGHVPGHSCDVKYQTVPIEGPPPASV